MSKRSTWDRLADSTPAIILGFIAILAAVAGGVALVFVTIQSTSDAPTGNWSPISDAINAVLGIPTALAGSLVAVALAHRAYVLAKSQVRLDSLSFLTPLLERTEQTYWNLAASLRDYEAAASELYQELLAESYRDSPKDEDDLFDGIDLPHLSALSTKTERFRGAVNMLSAAVLGIMRDPIARAVWESWNSERAEKAVIPKIEGFASARLRDNKMPAEVPFGAEVNRMALQDMAALLSAFDLGKSDSLKVLPRIIGYRNLLKQHGEPKPAAGLRKLMPDPLVLMVKSREFARKAFRRWNFGDDRERIEVMGALACLRSPRSLREGPMYNIGVGLLCELILRKPVERHLAVAIEAILRDRGVEDPELVSVAQRMLSFKGLEFYNPSWMQGAAEEIEKDASELAYTLPKHGIDVFVFDD